MHGIHRAIETLYMGEITFEAFVTATLPEWRRLARSLLLRWNVPAAVEARDVEQELLLAAWKALQGWHEGGATLGTHVVWTAITAAKKWLHGQRGALRRFDSSPSRHPIAVSMLGKEEDLEVMTDGEQELQVNRREQLGLVLRRLKERDSVCVLAFVGSGGEFDKAAGVLCSDLRTRVVLHIGCDDDARRFVRQAVGRAVLIAAN